VASVPFGRRLMALINLLSYYHAKKKGGPSAPVQRAPAFSLWRQC
jgi:hypothetical protein